jgi:dTDP-4-dehydrorhamnose reductase
VTRVLVTGARGLLGAAVAREFSRDGDVRALDHAALDVTDERAVTAAIADARPEVVINCAAYNHVDRAQREPVAALRVNAFAVLTLSQAAQRTGAMLVHYSTDFVFDGEIGRPYTEDDAPNPRGVYAASKLLGDWFALENARSYVLRVESLFGAPGAGGVSRGSLATIVDRIRAGEEVPLFTDRTVSPGYTADIAHATRQLIERRAPAGLYHCVNSGAASWLMIAEEAARLLGLPLRAKPVTLESMALEAPRPRFCALSNSKLASAGIAMPPWEDALCRYLRGEHPQ